MTEKTDGKKQKLGGNERAPVARVVASPIARDYARDVWQAGGTLAQLPRHIRAAMVLLARGYGLDPLAGDVLLLGTAARPVLYISAQAWMKRLVTSAEFDGYEIDRPATADEAREYGYAPPEPGVNAVWIVQARRKDWQYPIRGVGQADTDNVKLENASRRTDHRLLLRMAQKRAHHEMARKATAFVLDAQLWRAMDGQLRQAVERVAVQLADDVTFGGVDPAEVRQGMDRAGAVAVPSPETVAERAVSDDSSTPAATDGTVGAVAEPTEIDEPGSGDPTACPECGRSYPEHAAGCTIAAQVAAEKEGSDE